jgi:hypothetical protein
MEDTMPRPNDQKATLYAALKFLERELDKDGDLPPGFYLDVSNKEVRIKLPVGTVVERDAGTHGNGVIFKKATQNLYGYAFFAKLVERLKKFNQWNVLREAIIDIIRESLDRRTTSREQAVLADPELAAAIAHLQANFAIPARQEETPRICKDRGLPATIVITK